MAANLALEFEPQCSSDSGLGEIQRRVRTRLTSILLIRAQVTTKAEEFGLSNANNCLIVLFVILVAKSSECGRDQEK